MAISKFIKICILLSCVLILPSVVSASDVLVWQGQYYTGTTFNTGTYEFNFSVYDAPTGGNMCYSNTTTLTTGSFGEWKTEQTGVSSACNNVSKDYYLNININGAGQTPRRRLVVWNSLRKDVDEITSGKIQTSAQIVAPVIQADTQIIAPVVQADTQIIAPVVNATQVIVNNLTTTNYGFFNYLGSLVDRITKLWVVDIDASGNVNVSGNITASYFIGDGSLLTNLPAGGGETDPVWAANSSTVARAGECPAGQVVQNTTTEGVQCVTPAAAGAESDPQWSANFTNMQTDCNSGDYVYGVDDDGTLKCREDQTGSGGGGLTPVYSGSDLTATNTAYTTIFTIALTPSKMNIVKAYLAQSSSTNGVAIQNRVIVSESGPIGYCNFVTQTQAGTEVVDNIAVSTNSADTGRTTMGLDISVPFINTVTCTVLADANQRDLIIQFDSETVATVTTYAGSYYINAVN